MYNDIAEGGESVVTREEVIVNEGEVLQAINEMETIWRKPIIKAYRNDCVYQLAKTLAIPLDGRRYYTTAS